MRKKILFKDEEIAKELEWIIESRGYHQGDKLPSERELAESFGVQRDTIRNALDILIRKGTLSLVPRQGYYVAFRHMEFNVNDFNSVKETLESFGRKSRTEMLSFETVESDAKLYEKTLLPEGTPCYRISRLRYYDERPVSLERSFIVAEHAPGLKDGDLAMKKVADVMRKRYGISLSYSHQRVTQVFATDEEAELLDVSKGEPLMRYEGMVYDKQDRFIEFFDNLIHIEYLELRITEQGADQ